MPYLPDLYQKKFRLIERVERVRKEYFIDMKSLAEREQSISLQRKKTPWDIVIEEAKWVAIDMMEERKSKIAIAHYLSKKLKKQRINREINQNKVAMVHRLISSELASMVSRGFDCVYRNKQFAEKKEMDVESTKEIKREEMDIEGDGASKIDNFVESTISYEKEKKEEKPKKLKTLGKSKKMDSRANFDSEILDVEKTKGDTSTADINQVFKNASSVKKQLLENMFNTAARVVEQNLDVKVAQQSEIQAVIYQKKCKINRALCVKELQRCLKKYKNKVSNEPLEILNRIKEKDSNAEAGVDPLKSLQIAPEISIRDPALSNFALTREISTISTSAVSKEDIKLKKITSTTIPVPNPKEVAAQNAKIAELFMEGAYTFNFKDLKKIREKENSDELLILFYEEPMTDADYESMFKISVFSCFFSLVVNRNFWYCRLKLIKLSLPKLMLFHSKGLVHQLKRIHTTRSLLLTIRWIISSIKATATWNLSLTIFGTKWSSNQLSLSELYILTLCFNTGCIMMGRLRKRIPLQRD